MLQRIQSVWLLLGAAFAATTFRFPFYSGTLKPGATTFADPAPGPELNALATIWLTILTAVICGLALVTIFLYGNRKMQLRFSIIGLFLSIGLLALYFLQLGNFATGVMALSCIFYFAIPVCWFLAIRGIIRDDKLIRSMDRLR
ncbi:DUF4293 family protein [Flaviaesturariibacter flavus]|uniref:DUF4293 family protein n=1 Tax=Flaviaesturariibacter flavus TaxID=2502780 RepID=A0A4R1BC11_9BACT|nr:DUF4293 domain-containing protein [Flaviaesturariibacter flavus]TCJ14571.1 DUF4293 family protein [Flaviaesturariibacter flavus]